MTIGMIFECGPQGADKLVCEYLAGELRPGIPLKLVTLDNKPNLLAKAAATAHALLADGCARVLVIWDLRPAWPSTKNKPCRFNERTHLLAALANEGLQNAPVYLVCVEQEFESWRVADETKLSAFLSTPTRPYTVRKLRHPDREKNPKSLVMNHFKDARGLRYEDRVHAIKVMRTDPPPNWSKLRRSDSFARFEAKLIA